MAVANNSFFKITFFSVLNLLALFLFQGLLLYVFKPGEFLDAFYAAGMLYVFLMAVYSALVNSIVVPRFVGALGKSFSGKRSTISSILFFVSLPVALICLIQVACSEWLAAQVLGVDSPSYMMSDAIKIFALSGFVGALYSLFSALVTAQKYYTLPLLSQSAGAVVQFALVLGLADRLTLISLAWSFCILQLVSLTPLVFVCRKCLTASLGVPEEVRAIYRDSKFMLFSISVGKSDILIDRFLFTRAAVGALSSFSYGLLVTNLLMVVLSKAVSIISIVDLSGRADNPSVAERYLKSSFALYSYIVFVCATFIFLFLVVVRELSFAVLSDYDEIFLYANLLVGVLIGGCLSTLTSNYLFAVNKVKVIALFSVFGHLAFIPVKLVGLSCFGFLSIPLILSAKSLVLLVVVLIYIGRRALTKDVFNLEYLTASLVLLLLIFCLAFVVPVSVMIVCSMFAWGAVYLRYRRYILGGRYEV